MKQARMRFSDFIWPVNPCVVTVKNARRAAYHAPPFGEEEMEPMGRRGRVIEGSGRFYGSDAREQLERLRQTAARQAVGTLFVPGTPPMTAVLTELSMEQQPGPEEVAYTFTFVEQLPQRGRTAAGGRTYQAKEGDSLWNIALLGKTTVETLLRLNPGIPHPWAVPAGREVRLS